MRRVPWFSALACMLCGVGLLCANSTAWGEEPARRRGARSTLALTAQEPEGSGKGSPADGDKKHGGKLLVRELLRQAILIAGRDQLGLATRDMTLRESMPAEGAKVIDAQTAEILGESASLVLSINGGSKVLFKREIALAPESDAPLDYLTLSAAAEAWSRGELVEALREAGFAGEANPQSPEVKPSEAALTRLSQLNIFSQFAALRELHDLQHTRGESAETLGALVRAYANLGQLTSFHWNASHKAYRARSLLYAQRLMQAEKQSEWAYQHRAYALAIAGLHAAALADLKTAAEKAGAGKSSHPLADTSWAPMIEACCRFDVKALDEIEPAEEQRELLALLRFATIETSTSEIVSLAAGRRALEIAPECYRIGHSMLRFTTSSNRRLTTAHCAFVLQETLAIRLRDMPELPSAVEEELKKQTSVAIDPAVDVAWASGKQRQAMIASLVTAGAKSADRGEPSWELAGRLLEDENFAQVYRRLEHATSGKTLPREQFPALVELAQAAVGKHLYAPMLVCLGLNSIQESAQIQAISDGLKIVDADLSMSAFANRTANNVVTAKTYGNLMWGDFARHADDLSQEIEALAGRAKNVKTAKRLLAVSPRSPLAIGVLVDLDPKFATPHLREWRDEFGQHPGVLRALAERYAALRDFAEAASCREAYIQISPDEEGYTRLSDMYWELKQTDKWLKTLEKTLELEDPELWHARSRVKLARYYLEKNELEKAVAYADAAAPCNVNWALQTAADCHEALGHWDRAEELQRANSERFYNLQLEWYLWCRRTGHGDAAAAKKIALPAAKRMAMSKDVFELEKAGVFYLLDNDKESARAAFQKAFELSSASYIALHLSLLADAASDNAQRDRPLVRAAAMELVTGKPTPSARAQNDTAKWLAKAYKQSADAEPDLAALDELMKTPEQKDQALPAYFIGQYFAQHAKPDLARKYFKLSVNAAGPGKDWYLVPSFVRLRELTAEDAKKEKK